MYKRKFNEPSKQISIRVPESKYEFYKERWRDDLDGNADLTEELKDLKDDIIDTDITGNRKLLSLYVPTDMFDYYKKEFKFIVEHEANGELVEYTTTEFAEIEEDDLLP